MKKWFLIGLVAIIILLTFAVWAVAPLLITVRIDEPAPGTTVETNSDTPVETDSGAAVIGTTGHPASGSARIIMDNGMQYVRYENFKTINGPDLYVYLSKDLEAEDFVNLGEMKATEGNVNYAIPATANMTDYRYVLVWCKAFGVLFNYADLSAISTPH